MTNQDRFIEKVASALKAPTTHGRGDLAYADLPAAPERQAPGDLLELLAENAALLNIQLHVVADAAAAGETVREITANSEPEWDHQRSVMAWQVPLLQAVGVEAAVADGRMAFHWSPAPGAPITAACRDAFRRQLGEARIGITTADWCVADTGTLVLRNRPGEPVAVSLVPSVHVAIVAQSQLLYDFNDLYGRLREARRADPEALTARMTFISGPSKTGDIELVMVHGAHGPRALHLIVIRGA